MLAKGIKLQLLMGPVAVVPAPAVVIDALDSVKVTTAVGTPSGFELEFQFSARSDLNTLLLLAATREGGLGLPPLRVLLIVILDGVAQPLFDGVLTQLHVQGGTEGAAGKVTVIGEDVTKVMDMKDLSGLPFPAMPIEARVEAICLKYAAFGLAALVVPVLFADKPNPVERIPAQHGTDLQYLRRLARQVGYVFYVEPGPVPLTNVAYFGPAIKFGMPQPALNVDMDALTNVESLSFSFDATKGVLPVVYIQNEQTRAPVPVPIPDLNPLQPPLGVFPTPIRNMVRLTYTSSYSPMDAVAEGLSYAGASMDAVSADGSLNVLRYGRPLKAGRLVGVRGAGLAYDGLYYVQSVTSTLKRGEFKQSFKLTRNALVSLTPRVPV